MMNLIQYWNSPQFIYLLVLMQIGMSVYAHAILWKRLRSYQVSIELDEHFPRVPLRPLMIKLYIISTIEVAAVFCILLFMPSEFPFLTFIITLFVGILLAYGQILFHERFLVKYKLWCEIVDNNLKDISRPLLLVNRWIRPVSAILMFSLLILALMDPHGNERTTKLRRMPMQTTIAFDLSRSMYAADFEPNRLNAARDEAIALIEASQGDEIGLVYFTDEAMVQSPQTIDNTMQISLLKTASPADMPSMGTDINAALKAALTTFDENFDDDFADENYRARRIVLITDGENHSGDLNASLQSLIKRNIHVDVIAVGTENGAEILNDDGSRFMYQGHPVITKLQADLLENIAKKTGGKFTRLAAPQVAAREIMAYWDTIRIDMIPKKQSASFYREPLYPYLLYPAFLLGVIMLFYPMIANAVGVWRKRRKNLIMHARNGENV